MSSDPLDFEDPIEARLRAMRPAELPPELAASLVRAKPVRLHWLIWTAPLAAAAVWLAALILQTHSPSTSDPKVTAIEGTQPSDLRVFVPIEEKSTLVDVEDLGLVENSPSRPMRVLRYTWIDDTTFRGDDGRSTMRRTQPREQIVPVALPVF